MPCPKSSTCLPNNFMKLVFLAGYILNQLIEIWLMAKGGYFILQKTL